MSILTRAKLWMTNRSVGGYEQRAQKQKFLMSVLTRGKLWMTDRTAGGYKQLAQKTNTRCQCWRRRNCGWQTEALEDINSWHKKKYLISILTRANWWMLNGAVEDINSSRTKTSIWCQYRRGVLQEFRNNVPTAPGGEHSPIKRRVGTPKVAW